MYERTFCRNCGIEIEPGSDCYDDPEYMGQVLCPDCFDEYLETYCDGLRAEARRTA